MPGPNQSRSIGCIASLGFRFGTPARARWPLVLGIVLLTAAAPGGNLPAGGSSRDGEEAGGRCSGGQVGSSVETRWLGGGGAASDSDGDSLRAPVRSLTASFVSVDLPAWTSPRKPLRRVAPAPDGIPGDRWESSAFGIFGAYAQEYPWFKQQMGFSDEDYWAWVDRHFANLGAHWTRSNLQLIWDLVEPTIGGGYDWDNDKLTDAVITHVYDSPAGVHWLGVFHGLGRRNPLDYPGEFADFVQAAVERYDGDGIDDVTPGVAVKYWQAEGEIPGWISVGSDVEAYVAFVRLIRGAMLAADAEAKTVLMAPTNGFSIDPFLVDVIEQLAPAREFEVIDIHHWGVAESWKMTALPAYRRMLDDLGLFDVEIWSCENGTWAGYPAGQPGQSEIDQARSLVKRYVWNRAHGLDKLFWNNLMEWSNFGGDAGSVFNSMGLVSDGRQSGDPPDRLNTERIAYWSYRLLAEHTDVYSATQTGQMGLTDGNLYGYEYRRVDDGRALYVLWRENGSVTVNLRISGESVHVTNLVPDRFGNTEETGIPASNGEVTLTVGLDPLLIEER